MELYCSVALHKIQHQLTFKLKNKLNICIKHQLWYQNKIKIKYVAHTLSASVTNAMKYLENEDFEDFSNCETIIKFIRIEYLLE